MLKKRLGHYDLVGELGRGGMGVVYKGYEPSLNRHVAIKVLAASLADDAEVRERFVREARSMAALNDPHIIQIHFIGDDEGQTYFVMELVDGESLGAILERETCLTPEQAAKIVHQTAQGLATAHDQGVIHRDIKPGNLMISRRGSVKIADFGIALSTRDFSRKLTTTGEFVGTPGYLSPEVCLGTPVDQRSDIFSLGVVLFECLAGRMPFTDQSPLGLMLEVVKAEIPDVRVLNSDVDAELSRILGRMIAKEPGDRYQSCHELIEDLGRHPLIAKGGALFLATRPEPEDPERAVSASSMTAAATRATGAVASDASILRRTLPRRMAASDPMLARAPMPVPPRSVSVRHWAVMAAGVALIMASAWAYRDDLPFVHSPLHVDGSGAANITETLAPARVAVPSEPSALAGGGRRGDDARTTNPSAQVAPSGATITALTGSEARDADAVPLDEFLDDGPDDVLPANAYDPAVVGRRWRGNASPAYSLTGYHGPYAYPPALLPVGFAPVAYAPAPWHVGFGVGVGFWSAYAWPRPIYVGPVPRPVVAWPRPLPGPPVTVVAVSAARVTGNPLSPPAPRSGAPIAGTHARITAPMLAPRTAPASPAIAAATPHAGASPTAATTRAVAATAPDVAATHAVARAPQYASERLQGGGVGRSDARQFRPGQPRGEARMANNPQRRAVVLANQNAKRAARTEAQAAQVRAHAAQIRANAAHERKPKSQRRRLHGE